MTLKLRNISLKRGRKTLFKEWSAEFAPGSIVALVGKNGAGKSSLLQSLSGLLPLQTGSILVDGKDIHSLSLLERAQKITMLQQSSPLQPYCLAESRIAHGLIPRFGLHWPDKILLEQVHQMAAQLSISHLLERRLNEMSGGEQRLVDIAKVFVDQKTSLILLDEPSVFLDFAQKKDLAKNIRMRAGRGAIIFFSSHDLDFIAQTDAIILLVEETTRLSTLDQLLSSLGLLSSNNDKASSGLRPVYNT